MPKILMIVDLGHASPRFPGLCQELSRLGWDIDLISPRLSNRQKNLFLFKETRNWNLIETSRYRMRYKRYLNSPIHIKVLAKLSFKLVDSIRYLHQKLISESQEEYGLLDHAGWKRHVYRKVVQLTKSKKYDLVLSSSSPITAHVIARNVAEKLKLPWIADYRDLFSLNHTNPLGADSFRFESALLESANALTTVSAGFAKLQGQIYTGEIIVVNNGFKVLYPCKEAKLNGSIKILYTGTIEHGFQNLELFLEALEELNSNQVQAEVSFLGSSCSDVKHFYSIKSKAVPGFIHLNGNVSREESLSQQKSADLLLYFEWGNPEIDGVLLTKLYEYIASGSAILRVGVAINDEASRIFKCVGYPESLSTKKQIVDELSEIARCQSIITKRNDYEASYYSYASIASRLDIDLRRIIGGDLIEKTIGV